MENSNLERPAELPIVNYTPFREVWLCERCGTRNRKTDCSICHKTDKLVKWQEEWLW